VVIFGEGGASTMFMFWLYGEGICPLAIGAFIKVPYSICHAYSLPHFDSYILYVSSLGKNNILLNEPSFFFFSSTRIHDKNIKVKQLVLYTISSLNRKK
jgi:hypothetical protein